MIYEAIEVWESPSCVVLKGLTSPSTRNQTTLPPSALLIEQSGGATAQSSVKISVTASSPQDGNLSCVCHGLLGLKQFLLGVYVVLITGRELVGHIGSRSLWRISSTRTLRLFGEHSSSAVERKDEQRYKGMMESLLSENNFYFSTDYDITQSLQRVHALDSGMSFARRADDRFFWNKEMLKDVLDVKGSSPFALPVMMGYCEIRSKLSLGASSLDMILISRRSTRNCGVRYWRRGIDDTGECANTVETEMIVNIDGFAFSFVQIRGSIPLFWQQYPNIRYKPVPRLLCGVKNAVQQPRSGPECKWNRASDTQMQLPAATTHFERLSSLYGEVAVVDLINQQGSESAVGSAFRELMKSQQIKNCSYTAFDFHMECKGMRYDHINKLLKSIGATLEHFGMFSMDPSGVELSQQMGIIRCNCMDNLDRTNVVQSVIARKMVILALKSRDVADIADSVLPSHVEAAFKNMWADNADAISMQYAGTGALKTDFTRTGHRSARGLLSDGVNSLVRYYVNNFCDGFRQDAYDLFVGAYCPNRSAPSPFKRRYRFPVIALGLFVLLILALVFYPSGAPVPSLLLVSLMVLFTLCLALALVWWGGKSCVDAPQLRPILQ